MQLNKFIDHTLLKANATQAEIIQLCKEAVTYNFYAVCVNSCYVSTAKNELKNTTINVCCVIGFPLGAMSTKAKTEETKQAILDGADEIDMVINIGYLKSKDFKAVGNDIEAVKNVIPNKVLKVIIETCYLKDSEIIKVSEIAIKAGADIIKTSTGFGTGGASIEDVKIIKSVIKSGNTKIKASGGIPDTKTALAYINIGVNRIGTSNGVAIVTGKVMQTENY